MSENKFTPGPWEIGHDYLIQTVSTDGWEIAEVRQDAADFEANARLIAAAPDLLEALEYIFNEVGESMIADGITTDQAVEITKKCMVAIARARGEA